MSEHSMDCNILLTPNTNSDCGTTRAGLKQIMGIIALNSGAGEIPYHAMVPKNVFC